MKTVMLDGGDITIGDHTLIGAGSVVVKDIPADCVAVGNPCRVVKRLIQAQFASNVPVLGTLNTSATLNS